MACLSWSGGPCRIGRHPSMKQIDTNRFDHFSISVLENCIPTPAGLQAAVLWQLQEVVQDSCNHKPQLLVLEVSCPCSQSLFLFVFEML